MELYPGAHLIECEIAGRPLYLPLLLGETGAVLLDCGTKSHVTTEVSAFLDKVGLVSEGLTWLVITHPDVDHCGGLAEMARRYTNLRIGCGTSDCDLVESPEHISVSRYGRYCSDHGISASEISAAKPNWFSGPQLVSLAFSGGERLRLGQDRVLEVHHVPGHSDGHLAIYDQKYRTLFYGDAIQGSGYKSITGGWVLCPSYLSVESYLQTIHSIERLGADAIVGCHWPVLQGAREIGDFCTESSNFVRVAEHLVAEYLAGHPSGSTLRDLCEALGGKLGSWPPNANIKLCYALLAHLEDGLSKGTILADRSVRPVVYRRM